MTHPLTRPARGVLSGATARTGPPLVERPAPLREAVYDALVEMIITAELQPGEHLVENDLAAQLGVSRQPVRKRCSACRLRDGWTCARRSAHSCTCPPKTRPISFWPRDPCSKRNPQGWPPSTRPPTRSTTSRRCTAAARPPSPR